MLCMLPCIFECIVVSDMNPPPQVAAAQYFLNPNATDVNGCTTIVTAVERVFGPDALSKLADILPLSQKVRMSMDGSADVHAYLQMYHAYATHDCNRCTCACSSPTTRCSRLG